MKNSSRALIDFGAWGLGLGAWGLGLGAWGLGLGAWGLGLRGAHLLPDSKRHPNKNRAGTVSGPVEQTVG
ncbi:hypothetical protein QWU00_05235 [Acetobacter tropicalis]|uniref:hypothetical protein n=1 Tax=Acetobacter tropicalis TaxID=104102 RepID=UPI0027144A79|nr:hypothetical protein [Acetobacter tropicalis]MDO8171192.1 hypothetical protein [Acetobacter tropicalis]